MNNEFNDGNPFNLDFYISENVQGSQTDVTDINLAGVYDFGEFTLTPPAGGAMKVTLQLMLFLYLLLPGYLVVA